MVVYSRHFCVIVYAQDNWKDKDYQKFSDLTLADYLGRAEHSDCEICLTCPVCRANWELFDPENPGKYIQICEYCNALFPIFKKHLTGDGFILFSHELLKLEELKQFTEFSLNNNKIKKIFILEQDDPKRKPSKTQDMIAQINHQELKISEFLILIDNGDFEYNTIYEIFKDRYY